MCGLVPGDLCSVSTVNLLTLPESKYKNIHNIQRNMKRQAEQYTWQELHKIHLKRLDYESGARGVSSAGIGFMESWHWLLLHLQKTNSHKWSSSTEWAVFSDPLGWLMVGYKSWLMVQVDFFFKKWCGTSPKSLFLWSALCSDIVSFLKSIVFKLEKQVQKIILWVCDVKQQGGSVMPVPELA